MDSIFSSNKETHSIKYRADIDGLGGVAILMVVIYHFWPKLLPGGFIGVDIFFVISGFLITSIIYKEKRENKFSFTHFYLRRMKRILPAFFTMLLLTSLAAYFILLPDDLRNFALYATYSSAYLSNILSMHLFVDYFSPSSSEIPLLHTWSLAVEEQYYLLWPLFLYFIMKITDKKIFHIFFVGLIFLFSILFSIYCISHDATIGYYSNFSRAFELIIGSMVAMLMLSFRRLHSSNFYLNNAVSFFGLVFVFISCYILSENNEFPGYVALLPTTGAAMIIYAGCCQYSAKKTFINELLSTKFLVWIGLISYSVYLFHWPAIAFWHYLTPASDDLTVLTGFALIALVLFISMLTYKFVEHPFKLFKLKFYKCLLLYQVLPLLIVSLTAYFVVKPTGLPERFPEIINIESHHPSEYCFNGETKEGCIFGKKDKLPVKVLLFGDSHAASLGPFFNKIANQYDFSFKMISAGGCYPLLDTKNHFPSTNKNLRSPTYCKKQIQYVTDNYNNFDVFILSGNYRGYISIEKESSRPDMLDFLSEFKNTVNFLISKGKKVIVVADVPVDNKNFIAYFIRNQAVFGDRGRAEAIRSRISMNQSEGNIIVRNSLIKNKSVYFFDINQQVFSTIKSLPFYHDFLIYKDSDHLNEHGSLLLAEYYLSLSKSPLKKKLIEWGVVYSK